MDGISFAAIAIQDVVLAKKIRDSVQNNEAIAVFDPLQTIIEDHLRNFLDTFEYVFQATQEAPKLIDSNKFLLRTFTAPARSALDELARLDRVVNELSSFRPDGPVITAQDLGETLSNIRATTEHLRTVMKWQKGPGPGPGRPAKEILKRLSYSNRDTDAQRSSKAGMPINASTPFSSGPLVSGNEAIDPSPLRHGIREQQLIQNVNFTSGRNNKILRIPAGRDNSQNNAHDIHLQAFIDCDGVENCVDHAGHPLPAMSLIFCDEEAEKNTLPFSKEVFTTLIEKQRVPSDFLSAMIRGTPSFRRIHRRAGESTQAEQRIEFVLRMPLAADQSWTLGLSWDPTYSRIFAVVHGLQDTDQKILSSILKSERASATHPLLLPILLCEMLTDDDVNNVDRHALDLSNIAMHTITMVSAQNEATHASALGTHNKHGAVTADFDGLTRRLNAITNRLAFHEMRAKANTTLANSILGCMDDNEIRNNAPLARTPPTAEWHITLNKELEGKVRNLLGEHTALLNTIACHQKIAHGQSQTVFNLVAQRDARVSISMATITKNDSFAMRTIAVMTVFFLPATAISSIFSMSMFDWRAGSLPRVTSSYFWLYWAVAVPLTLAVMVTWRVWNDVHSKYERRAYPELVTESVLRQENQRLSRKLKHRILQWKRKIRGPSGNPGIREAIVHINKAMMIRSVRTPDVEASLGTTVNGQSTTARLTQGLRRLT